MKDKIEKNIEKETQEINAIEKIKKLSQKREENETNKFKMPSSEFIKETIKELPQKLQEELIIDYERLLSYGSLNKDQINKEIAVNFQKIQKIYSHNFLNMPNKNFAKFKTIQYLDKVISKEDLKIKDLKKVVRISLDLNGLKAVNDLNYSHEHGDDYLRLVKEALKDSDFIKFLDNNEINHIETADGGDEFGIIMFSNKAIEDEIVTKAMNIVKQKLENSDKAQKILDFSDPNIILAHNGVSKNDIEKMTPEKKTEMVKKFKKTIPDDYKFKAVVSMGAANFFDGILASDIKEYDTYDKAISKIMGKIFNISDKRMQSNKEAYKQAIKQSNNKNDNFLAEIYSRTETEQELLQENKDLKQKIQELQQKEEYLKQEMQDMKKLMDTRNQI